MVYVQAVLYIVLCSIASTQAGYDYSYLEYDCYPNPNRVIYLGRDGASTYGVVQLNYGGEYNVNQNCSLKLVPPAGYTLHIVLDWVDIDYIFPPCSSYDYLEISNDVFAEQYCGSDSTDKMLTMNNYAIVRFVSDFYWSAGHTGFYLYYNLYQNKSCDTDEYACVNNRCILSELTCDDKNNCGDYTDENRSTCPLPGWVIFLIVLGSLLVVGTIVIMVVACCQEFYCSKKSKPTVHEVYAVNTTTGIEEPKTMA